MKNYMKFLIVIILPLLITFNGCILDSLNDITVSMPYASGTITLSGSQSSITNSASFDISKSEIYQKYKDKLNSITFIKAQVRTIDISDKNIKGDLVVTVKDKNGITLFSISEKNIAPADYIATPFKLKLTQSDIQKLNTYLKLTGNTVFSGTVTVNNISGGTTPRVLKVKIDMAFSINANT